MTRTPLLTIRQVRAISAVAAHASLAQAGEHLGTSQSSLSRQIAEAERAIGQRLFQRGWTGMEPTSQGDVVIAHCDRMIAGIRAAEDDLRSNGARVADLSHHLTWHVLAAADAVLARRSVSSAADDLGVSQPDVSRSLAKIAAAIGRQPFRRTRTGMEGTRDAEILADLHGTLRLDLAALLEQLGALSGQVTGRVAVGLLPFSEQDIVVKVFGIMLKRHRHVRLQAVTGSYAALVDGLRRGELDFVLGPLRHAPPFEGAEEMHLHDERFAVVVRAGHRLARGEPGFAALARQSWVVAPHGTPIRRYFEDLMARQGVAPPRRVCEIVTFSLAERMIMHSDVIGLLTYSENKKRRLSEKLRMLAVELPDSVRGIGLTFRRHHASSAAQQVFLELLLGHRPR